MDINSIPEIFQSKIRLSIISALITGKKTFKQLKEITLATDGNLSIHLNKLEEVSYIIITKEFIEKKPRTTYSITPLGISDFKNYVELLENILKSVQDQ